MYAVGIGEAGAAALQSNAERRLATNRDGSERRGGMSGERGRRQMVVHKEAEVRWRRNRLLFAAASQPDIVRAYQKDATYRKGVAKEMQELTATWVGQRFAMRHQKEVEVLAELLYLSVNTGRGKQTLGEEYCDIVQVDETNAFPSMQGRARLVAWAILVPYLGGKLVAKLNAATRPQYGWKAGGEEKEKEEKWKAVTHRLLQWCIGTFSRSKEYFGRLHLAFFYFFGRYFEVSKRLAGVTYMLDRPSSILKPHYRLLGLLVLAQLVHSTYVWVRQLVARGSASQDKRFGKQVLYVEGPEEEEAMRQEVEQADGEQPMCTLCLEPRIVPTVTECGHIFCWNCIHDACHSKAECPLCRATITATGLCRVFHYAL